MKLAPHYALHPSPDEMDGIFLNFLVVNRTSEEIDVTIQRTAEGRIIFVVDKT